MSLEAMTWAFQQEVAGNEKLVLLALADHADENWSCYPGHETIAAKASIAERTVRDVLERLREKKLVNWEHRNSKTTGYRTSNRYTLAPGLTADSAGWPTGRSDAPTGNLLPVEGNPQIEPSGTNTRAKSKKSQMTEDWQPVAADVAWAKGEGYEVPYLQHETQRFVNHFLANGESKVLWGRAWRNWIDQKFVHSKVPSKRNAQQPPKSRAQENYDGLVAAGIIKPEVAQVAALGEVLPAAAQHITPLW